MMEIIRQYAEKLIDSHGEYVDAVLVNDLTSLLEDIDEKHSIVGKKELLVSFYTYLEENSQFIHTKGWGEFWAEKYLENNK